MQQPPGGWGPQGPQQGYGQGYGPQQYQPPPQVVYVQQQPKAGASCGQVLLWIFVAFLALNVGGCIVCMSVAAIGSVAPGGHR